MGTWELVLICLGLSFDIYAVAACEGATLEKIRGRDLLALCGIFLLFQLAAIAAGSLLSLISAAENISAAMLQVWRVVSIVIISALGGLLLFRGIRNKPIAERRKTLRYRDASKLAAITSIDILLVCMGLGAWSVDIGLLIGLITASTLLAVCVGLFTGYLLGCDKKRIAYFSGSALLLAACVVIMVREVI